MALRHARRAKTHMRPLPGHLARLHGLALAAGLLARGSIAPCPFPIETISGDGRPLAAYSCEGSSGLGP